MQQTAAMPPPISFRCRERFSSLIFRIAISRIKTAFSQVFLPTLTGTEVSKHKSRSATTITLSILLLLYRNLSHTKSPIKEAVQWRYKKFKAEQGNSDSRSTTAVMGWQIRLPENGIISLTAPPWVTECQN